MTSLSDIKGFNEYCGPSVLAALTGRSTDACAAVISAVSGQKVIKAVAVNHLIEALKRIEFEATELIPPARTVYGCLSALVNKDGFYIINVPRHVVAVEIKNKTIYLIDNHTKHAINAGASARLTQAVERVYQVKPKPKPTLEEVERERKTWLREQIHLANLAISRRVEERERFIAELESLEKETK